MQGVGGVVKEREEERMDAWLHCTSIACTPSGMEGLIQQYKRSTM